MIIIPEQIKILREEKRRLQESIDNYKNYFADRQVTAADETFASVVGDGFTEGQYISEINALRDTNELLENAKYLRKRVTDKIDIGTKFSVKFNDSDEVEKLILVDELISGNKFGIYTSSKSIMGKVILGKKKDDIFSYQVRLGANEISTISGRIVDINDNPKDYESFITEKPYGSRISYREKQKNKKLFNSENLEEIRKATAITESQKELLQLEVKRLTKRSLITPSEKSRLAYIKNILDDDNIAQIPKDNKIGIGTHFSIMLMKKDKTEIKRVEMINRAVSDETSDEYIERISPLGSTIFGKKDNDEIIVRDGKGKFYSGIIFDVDNDKHSCKTIDPLLYQKTK